MHVNLELFSLTVTYTQLDSYLFTIAASIVNMPAELQQNSKTECV